MQIPFFKHLLEFALSSPVHNDQHALLTLREHDLVRIHSGLALRHEIQIDFNPGIPPGCSLARRTGQTGRSHILNAYHQPGNGHHLQASLEQKLFHERIPLLHGRPILGALLGQFA